ncbi:MAG: DUF177 domain-containing protein [Bacteroidales bacterium]|nr:DUF177 domain-containing protein [Bacteroidales bacterium]HOI31408.1 DUF177 domain-containing protein [Bacteroidales bacterium]
MKPFQEFIVPIAGLSAGMHHYTFVVDDAFFAAIDYAEIRKAKIQVELTLDKQDNMLSLDFDLEGDIEVPCDRCNEDFMYPIESDYSLYVKFGESYQEEDDDVLVIPTDQHQLEIHHLLYEYILLSLPLRKVHPDNEDGTSGCDPVVLARLEQMTVTEETDPRWEALEKLRNKLD